MPQETESFWVFVPLALHWILSLGFSLRVIMLQRSVGATLAWVSVMLLVPYFGVGIYLLMGELRLGKRREKRIAQLISPYKSWISSLSEGYQVDWSEAHEAAKALDRLALQTEGTPTLPGNRLELLDDCEGVLRAIIEDVNRAEETLYMEFYIWHNGGVADEVLEAVIKAAQRGVITRLLLDSVGSKDFLKSTACANARQEGVEIVEALPAGILRALFRRQDLRLHRKIIIVDGHIAYTGSLNLVDARFFKQDAGVGQWIDLMVRVQGPAVEVLATTFLADWDIETDGRQIDLNEDTGVKRQPANGPAMVQVVPSGPGFYPDAIYQLLLSTIYSAREELIITTPYFVPDDALHSALCTAAARGVKVTVVLPEHNDSRLVRYASRSYFDSLLAAGVRIMRFRDGLLHAKTITVDQDFCLIGSVNFDMRSVWLNHEVTLFVYNHAFTDQLRYCQHQYISQSDELTAEEWSKRPTATRVLESIIRLTSPLL
ncbi:cardiolipin synthase [Cerasicoccus arenae]|uniref:cardiolipin synthase n=1 Tax=Cerasicoccus arenae TaxID=424488 RepID=UPI001905E3E7|nr:cardiolipin synthase [Cerasicoccus arenae]MBK1859340.1 cardiolipin synthase [Cerasicoccus arenae]